MEKVANYIERSNEIYLLLKYTDQNTEGDVLIKLFHELMDIIIYGDIEDLIIYAKKCYDLNIPVDSTDNLGTRIKSFIMLYLNDVIEDSLLKQLENETRTNSSR